MGITCYFPQSCQVVRKASFQPLPTEPGAAESRCQRASRTQGAAASQSPPWAPPSAITRAVAGASAQSHAGTASILSGQGVRYLHESCPRVGLCCPHQGGSPEVEVRRAAFPPGSTRNTLGKPERSSTKLTLRFLLLHGQVLPGLDTPSPRLQVSPTQKAACASRAGPDWAGVS